MESWRLSIPRDTPLARSAYMWCTNDIYIWPASRFFWCHEITVKNRRTIAETYLFWEVQSWPAIAAGKILAGPVIGQPCPNTGTGRGCVSRHCWQAGCPDVGFYPHMYTLYCGEQMEYAPHTCTYPKHMYMYPTKRIPMPTQWDLIFWTAIRGDMVCADKPIMLI